VLFSSLITTLPECSLIAEELFDALKGILRNELRSLPRKRENLMYVQLREGYRKDLRTKLHYPDTGVRTFSRV
jgi:hypothetical protein